MGWEGWFHFYAMQFYFILFLFLVLVLTLVLVLFYSIKKMHGIIGTSNYSSHPWFVPPMTLALNKRSFHI